VRYELYRTCGPEDFERGFPALTDGAINFRPFGPRYRAKVVVGYVEQLFYEGKFTEYHG
jgi:hypothetical protein